MVGIKALDAYGSITIHAVEFDLLSFVQEAISFQFLCFNLFLSDSIIAGMDFSGLHHFIGNLDDGKVLWILHSGIKFHSAYRA